MPIPGSGQGGVASPRDCPSARGLAPGLGAVSSVSQRGSTTEQGREKTHLPEGGAEPPPPPFTRGEEKNCVSGEPGREEDSSGVGQMKSAQEGAVTGKKGAGSE